MRDVFVLLLLDLGLGLDRSRAIPQAEGCIVIPSMGLDDQAIDRSEDDGFSHETRHCVKQATLQHSSIPVNLT